MLFWTHKNLFSMKKKYIYRRVFLAGDMEPSMQDFMASEIGKPRSLLDDDLAKVSLFFFNITI